MIRLIKHWGYVLYISIKRLIEERFTYKASALAFTTLLGMVPMFSVIVSLMSYFPTFYGFIELAQTYLINNFMPTADQSVRIYLEGFIHQAANLPLLGIMFLAVTAIMLLMTVQDTLDDIWQTETTTLKLTDILIYWTVLLATPVFLGLSIFISSYIFSLQWYGGAKYLHLGLSPLAMIPFFINTCIFMMLYTVMPNIKVAWRDGLLGGLIASTLFESGKKMFVVYLKQFPSYEVIYGTLAAIPIFLVWLYISWLIILFGAIVTNTNFRIRKGKYV